MLDVSNLDYPSSEYNISDFQHETIVKTTFHINDSLMTYLQRDSPCTLVLQLYSTTKQEILSIIKFDDDISCNSLLTHPSFSRALMIFDPTDKSMYLVLLITQPDEIHEEDSIDDFNTYSTTSLIESV